MKPVADMFSQSDRDRIAAAVRDAEAKTSGEIVPYIVERSDAYEDAEWRGAALGAILTFCVLTIVRHYTGLWIPLDVPSIGLATLAVAAISFLAVKYVPWLKVRFAGKHLIDHRVGQRAAEAFITEEVFLTSERTGILIFVSLLEHRVLVVGDSGIHAKVQQSDWHDVVRRVLQGIGDGHLTDGLVDAIGQCGALLAAHGVQRRADDRDELKDSLRTSDR